MEMLSWSEIDDLRANLRADERAQFDEQLHELVTRPDGRDGDDTAYQDLIARWRAVTRRADLPAARYRFVEPRHPWLARLTTPAH